MPYFALRILVIYARLDACIAAGTEKLGDRLGSFSSKPVMKAVVLDTGTRNPSSTRTVMMLRENVLIPFHSLTTAKVSLKLLEQRGQHIIRWFK
jgi:hypothetical protein